MLRVRSNESALNSRAAREGRSTRAVNPKLPRLAGAVGLSASLLLLSGCDLSPESPHEVGAANRVTDHLPSSPETTVTATLTPPTATVTEAAPTTITKTAPPTTEAPEPTVTVTVPPTPTQAPPTPESITVEGVTPNLAGAKPGDCGVGGTMDHPQLEGLVGPYCDEQAPVLVVGKVHPLCRILGGPIPLRGGEVHHAWIVWEATDTHKRYVSPNAYLNVGPMAPCSPANNTFGVPNADS